MTSRDALNMLPLKYRALVSLSNVLKLSLESLNFNTRKTFLPFMGNRDWKIFHIFKKISPIGEPSLNYSDITSNGSTKSPLVSKV